MSRLPNIFRDPKGVRPQYAWQINHSEEQPVSKSRQMGDGAPTSNVGLIPQQGPATPIIFQWKGTIFDIGQLTEMLAWWQLCETQSIYLIDFSGAEYEVIIEDFAQNRKGVARNPRDVTRPWIWEYTINMRILHVYSGEWFGVTT